eukprot:4640586-Ditylum_brightwellii.AAC.1
MKANNTYCTTDHFNKICCRAFHDECYIQNGLRSKKSASCSGVEQKSDAVDLYKEIRNDERE